VAKNSCKLETIRIDARDNLLAVKKIIMGNGNRNILMKKMNISFDANDNIAAITRQLINQNKYFGNLVFTPGRDSVRITEGKKNFHYLTTFKEFCATNELLLGSFGGGTEIDEKFKHRRLSLDSLNTYISFLERIWMRMLKQCPSFDDILSGAKSPGHLRQRTNSTGQAVLNEKGKPIPGGNVFAYPIGQLIFAELLKVAVWQGKSVEDTIDVIMATIPMAIDEDPWVNIIWDPVSRNIISTDESKRFMVSFLSYSLNLSATPDANELTKLYQDLSGRKNAMLPLIGWSGSIQEEIDDGGVLCL
jgi:DNA sulfur modification protein DndB